MDSSCSTPSSSRSNAAGTNLLPIHQQYPSGSSTTGPAVYLPSVHNLRPGQLYVTVQTLSKETLVIAVTPKTRVHHVLWKCGEILEIAEDKLFGLALRQPTEGIGNDQPRHEYFFLDPAAKIVKYAPKQPRFANWHNRSSENRPLLALFFRVRVYIDNDRLLSTKDERALEQYYLQLKENFLDQWSNSHCVSEERCWEMAALALRADKGDNPGGYFRAEQYFPMWVIVDRGLDYIGKNMPAVTEDLKDTERREAMSRFCLEASRSPFALNCHLYGLRRHKMDNIDNAVLGITARGIEMYDVGKDGVRALLRFLPWKKVTKLSFDRKKIGIMGADGTKMSLYAQSESKARYLLELCRSVHQALLVLSHKSAINGNYQLPFTEKSVDRASTSSVTGVEDVDSLLHDSACSSGERLQGSVSSKQKIRVKLDSNLELKIEKMELESIRQDRAASQSSKVSETSDKKPEVTEEPHTPPPADSARPSSVDSASQTVDSVGSRHLDLNYNSKTFDHDHYSHGMIHHPMHHTYGPIAYVSEVPYTPSNGSRSDSVQQSNEAIPEVIMIHSYHPDSSYGRSDDTDSTLRPQLPPNASMSLHDLRGAPGRYLDQIPDVRMGQRSVSPNGKPRWTTVAGMIPSTHYYPVQPGVSMQPGQARSEPRIDSDLWAHPSVSAALLDSPTSNNGGGRLFTKRTNSGASRQTASINRVRSMPAHFHSHVANGYQRNSPTEDYHPQAAPALQYAQSMNVPRLKREPPSYDRAVSTLPQMQPQVANSHGVPPNSCPLPAETPGGQPSFPPASTTQQHFNAGMDFLDDDTISSERLRDYPFIHRLWKEQQQQQQGAAQNRPSSCLDLAVETTQIHQHNHLSHQIYTSQSQLTNGMFRNEYIVDNAPYVQYQGNRLPNHPQSYAPIRGVASNGGVVLPPPPPYPTRKVNVVM